MKLERAAGVLLHPTCLPGRWGMGDLGAGARRYVEWLAACGVRWWQMLPANPAGHGFCPYSATSTFALSPLLIDPEQLRSEDLLDAAALDAAPAFSETAVDVERVVPFREGLLRHAWRRFLSHPPAGLADEFDAFRDAERDWLDDYALFAATARTLGTSAWREWPRPLALREPDALAGWQRSHADAIAFHAFGQFLAFRQWEALREFAHDRDVRLFGDLPIYVAFDSAEVWAHQDLFRLAADGAPEVVAGVPPDYFSATGQRWGNPIYAWERHAADGWTWWIARVRQSLRWFDLLRIDHFRGFAGFWEIPADEPTAVNGRWVTGPGRAVFDALRGSLGDVPLVAEDLGVITPDVEALRDALDLPGMAVLQFAFAPGEDSPFLPHHHHRNQVVYTGTHDNNTTLGWWMGDASDGERETVRRYLATDAHEINWDLIRAALGSVAGLAVVPHQDLAGLGGDCRMNTPGTATGNWRFRITDWMLGDPIRDRLADLVRLFGRAG